MSDYDRDKWNAKYADPSIAATTPSALVADIAPFLPASGRAIDLAGGGGRHALWLASQGLETTLADISTKALAIAAERAAQMNRPLVTIEIDLETQPVPNPPWDVILTCLFLRRELIQTIHQSLAPGGVYIMIQPTAANLERHAKPPRDFLLNDEEGPTLLHDQMEILTYQEGWLADGRHDCLLVARKRHVA